MTTIPVKVLFPASFEPKTMDIELTEIELAALVNSQKFGFNGQYFKIHDFIFESRDGHYSLDLDLEGKKDRN